MATATDVLSDERMRAACGVVGDTEDAHLAGLRLAAIGHIEKMLKRNILDREVTTTEYDFSYDRENDVLAFDIADARTDEPASITHSSPTNEATTPDRTYDITLIGDRVYATPDRVTVDHSAAHLIREGSIAEPDVAGQNVPTYAVSRIFGNEFTLPESSSNALVNPYYSHIRIETPGSSELTQGQEIYLRKGYRVWEAYTSNNLRTELSTTSRVTPGLTFSILNNYTAGHAFASNDIELYYVRLSLFDAGNLFDGDYVRIISGGREDVPGRYLRDSTWYRVYGSDSKLFFVDVGRYQLPPFSLDSYSQISHVDGDASQTPMEFLQYAAPARPSYNIAVRRVIAYRGEEDMSLEVRPGRDDLQAGDEVIFTENAGLSLDEDVPYYIRYDFGNNDIILFATKADALNNRNRLRFIPDGYSGDATNVRASRVADEPRETASIRVPSESWPERMRFDRPVPTLTAHVGMKAADIPAQWGEAAALLIRALYDGSGFDSLGANSPVNLLLNPYRRWAFDR